MNLHPPRPVVVVVGGAGGFDEADSEAVRPLFAQLVALLAAVGAAGIDGGTSAGVMRLVGEARAATGVPLIGVVAEGTVRLPGAQYRDGAATLEPHHTHFIVVPGDQWGAESPWIAQTATVLAGSAPSVTVLVNGGEVAYSDVDRSVQAGRPVIAVVGTGRTADVFGAALAGGTSDRRAADLAESGLIRSVPANEPARLIGTLRELLSESTTEEPPPLLE